MRKLFLFYAAYGDGFEGVIGPGMLGIPAAQFFADLKIGGLPEAVEVGSELYRLEAR